MDKINETIFNAFLEDKRNRKYLTSDRSLNLTSDSVLYFWKMSRVCDSDFFRKEKRVSTDARPGGIRERTKGMKGRGGT